MGGPPSPYRSFSNNINPCLFRAWVTAGVLQNEVACTSQQLCYGAHNGGQALFAVCYNTNTLIPEFTGNIVQYGGTEGEQGMISPPDAYDGRWKTDDGLVQADIPVALDENYDADKQKGKFANFNSLQNQFLARGHLTPNGDFSKKFYENSFTYVTTNIAPQWQPFNMGNWAVVETTVQKYANQKQGRTVYVFTGTGGRAKNNDQEDILLEDRVLTPKYYWKAVCDPAVRQSIVFVAENKPGDINNAKAVGCYGKQQTERFGIVYCYSLQGARAVPDYKDFKLPPFSDPKCKPDTAGTFLKDFFNRLK